MKTIRIISTIAVICLISLNVQGQSKKGESKVTRFTVNKIWVDGLEEYVKGAIKMEITSSENLEETIAIGTGLGSTTGFLYEVSSEFSQQYHGKDNKDFKFTQVVFVRFEGKLIIKIMRMSQVRSDDAGNQTIDVIKDEITDYR